MPGKYWSCQCCKSGQSELWNKIQLMSWSKYHRITIIVTRTIPGRRPDKFCGTWGVLVWYPKKEPQHNSWCPDVGQSLSISPLGFHCWPKPPSSHHRLQNIGLIKTQSNYINLGGSTEHTSQLTPETWDLRPEKMRADLVSLLLATVSVRPSVIVNWRVRPGLESDWQPQDHWRYSHQSSASTAQRRNSPQDFGQLVKERFLYSHQTIRHLRQIISFLEGNKGGKERGGLEWGGVERCENKIQPPSIYCPCWWVPTWYLYR